MFPNSKIHKRLSRKFLLGNAAGLLLSSMVFFVLYMGMYRNQLEQERSTVAEQINHLLQTSLENAMLKRDLDGLQYILQRLGQQEGMANIMIINPLDEVRFTSNPELLGRRLSRDKNKSCTACHSGPKTEPLSTVFTTNELGQSVLRSVNPVRNRQECSQCHGPPDQNPINGVLFVDYDAQPIQEHARNTTLMLMGAGFCVIFITLSGGWWFMRKFVLAPVNTLATASNALAGGALDKRVAIQGEDELAQLGRHFNRMAEALEQNMKELQKKEKFLQNLVDAIPDGVRIIDDNYDVLLVNNAYCAMIGQTNEQMLHRKCYKISFDLDKPCAPTLRTCPVHELKTSSSPVKVVQRHLAGQGKRRDIEIYAAPMLLEIGGENHRLAVESIRDLGKQIDFSHEQKLSELGQLAAGVAHEIHNPLSSIRLSLDTMLRTKEESGRLADNAESYIRLVDHEIDRCLSITERLLKLSVVSNSPVELVNVNRAVVETTSLLNLEAEQSGIRVETELEVPEPRLLAGESDLRIVILNLTQNAFHAMPGGGKLTIVTRREQGRISINFKDSGVGVPETDMPFIFDPFFSRRADRIRGTGLGLSISRAIVERYDGSLTASSEVGVGSEFQASFIDPEVNP